MSLDTLHRTRAQHIAPKPAEQIDDVVQQPLWQALSAANVPVVVCWQPLGQPSTAAKLALQQELRSAKGINQIPTGIRDMVSGSQWVCTLKCLSLNRTWSCYRRTSVRGGAEGMPHHAYKRIAITRAPDQNFACVCGAVHAAPKLFRF